MLQIRYSWTLAMPSLKPFLQCQQIYSGGNIDTMHKSKQQGRFVLQIRISPHHCMIEKQTTVMANLPFMYILGGMLIFFLCCFAFCFVGGLFLWLVGFFFFKGDSLKFWIEKNPQWTRKGSLQEVGRTSLHVTACLVGMNCICFSKVKTQILQIPRP